MQTIEATTDTTAQSGTPPVLSCGLCAAPHDGPAGLCPQCFYTHVAGRQPQVNQAKTRTRRAPVFLIDTDGAEIALLKTNKVGLTVKLLAADLRALVDRGFTDQVTLIRDSHSGYHYAMVNVTGLSGATVTLARLIADAKRGRNVNYADGDRLNLRRDNLVIVKGCGKNVVQTANRLKAIEVRAIAAERA